MRLSVISLCGLAMVLPLLGQGCAYNQSGSLDGPERVDASVEAILEDSSEVDRVEQSGDADADLIENNKAELNSYSEMNYDLP